MRDMGKAAKLAARKRAGCIARLLAKVQDRPEGFRTAGDLQRAFNVRVVRPLLVASYDRSREDADNLLLAIRFTQDLLAKLTHRRVSVETVLTLLRNTLAAVCKELNLCPMSLVRSFTASSRNGPGRSSSPSPP